jgi:hypothetical protein
LEQSFVWYNHTVGEWLEKLQVAIKQLFFDENMTELIVQEIPFWGNGTGSNGEMPLIPPKQSF